MLKVRSTTRPVDEILSSEEHLLAVFEFDEAVLGHACDPRRITIPLQSSERIREVWTSLEPITSSGHYGSVNFVRTSRVTMGSIVMSDSDKDVEGTAERIYSTLLESLDTVAHQHLWRVWNYFPRITDGTGDQERYRRFSVGRARALAAAGIGEQSLPPATAIGTSAGPWVVIFLAGETPCLPIENPRQTSAYLYPRAYGPASPSFARAAIVKDRGRPEALVVSGTASIVGHETRHPGRWREQLGEIHKNILSLLTSARVEADPALLRLYARPHVPIEAVSRELTHLWGTEVPIIALRGSICREDLLIEIEGWWDVSDSSCPEKARQIAHM